MSRTPSLGAIGATGTAAANCSGGRGGTGNRDRDAVERLQRPLPDRLPGPARANLVNVMLRRSTRRSTAAWHCDARVAEGFFRHGLAGVLSDWEDWVLPRSATGPPREARASAAAQHPMAAARRSSERSNDAAGRQVVCSVNAAGSVPAPGIAAARADPRNTDDAERMATRDGVMQIPGGSASSPGPRRGVRHRRRCSYLMLPGELVTAVAERVPPCYVLIDNRWRRLDRVAVGAVGFGRDGSTTPSRRTARWWSIYGA